MSRDTEKWISIPNTNYEISNMGNIRNLKTKKIVKQHTTPTSDRLYVKVRLKDNKGVKHLNVAREVAKAFIIQINEKNFVNHKDGNKKNNCVENLEWCNRSENEKHAYKNKLKVPTRGEQSGKAKLTWDDIYYIREKYKPFSNDFSIRALAKKFNVSKSTIQYIVNNKTWKEK